jgi:hypothetical protein
VREFSILDFGFSIARRRARGGFGNHPRGRGAPPPRAKIENPKSEIENP